MNTEFETPTPSAEDFATRFARLLALDQVIVLLVGGVEPAGFAYEAATGAILRRAAGQLEELYVRPHLRDRGVGTALLQRALELCRERHAGEMHINLDEVDADTRRFCERHGFLNVLPGTAYQMVFYEQELCPSAIRRAPSCARQPLRHARRVTWRAVWKGIQLRDGRRP